MQQKIWTEEYRITSYLVNLRGKAGLYAILNLIQDVGWQHAMDLNIKLNPKHAWVFTRQKLNMYNWPAWNESVKIQTWLRPAQKASPFIQRDYELFVKDKKIGECTSTFTVIDLETRKLAPQDWSEFPQVWRTDHQLAIHPNKIAWNDKIENLAEFQVRNSDIDLNHHVNNTKYAKWILDALSLDILKGGVDLHSYEVNFLAESKSGDIIMIQKVSEEKTEGQTTTIQFQGQRKSDLKPVFTSQMVVKYNRD